VGRRFVLADYLRMHRAGLIHRGFLKSTSFCFHDYLIISGYHGSAIENSLGVTHLTTHVLYLCTGNSCRSQIAEGWTRTLGDDEIGVESAGIEAHGKNPRAIAVMKEAGVDISGQESTIVNQQMLERAEVVVTVCGHADEQCPALPPGVKKVHWPLSDPAKASGSEEEIMAEFRATRDEVKRRVESLLDRLRQKRE
jgi:arsenate reductase